MKKKENGNRKTKPEPKQNAKQQEKENVTSKPTDSVATWC